MARKIDRENLFNEILMSMDKSILNKHTSMTDVSPEDEDDKLVRVLSEYIQYEYISQKKKKKLH